ncbi:Pogo transposable element with KRAB domain-like [Phytophthora palmivora]|uniref:Pogo transposable element with KRAB domain-like n=1 Tax=Phytophthora palmivora TaxID=4796 RepID=A0A2P4WZW3_9STRA|nr:Pogo transposable element with KRAB domain-like [Phytophthora palmivora]
MTFGTNVEIIHGGYTCVLQSCNVGINKPLKDKLRSLYNERSVDKIGNLCVKAAVPVPDRDDIVPWMVKAWAQTSESIIRETFHAIGYGVDGPLDQVSPSSEAATQEGDEDGDVFFDIALK